MTTEPGTKRLFVSTMRGMLFSIDYDGKKVTPYIDINAANWNVAVQSGGSERGLQSFAFHPQFAERGKPGYGKFYTYTDTSNMTPPADFVSGGRNRTHDTVLLNGRQKTRARAPTTAAHERSISRRPPVPQSQWRSSCVQSAGAAGSADYGMLDVGFADGGAGGDPMNLAQNLASPFGKILRLDPLGTNGPNGRYGIPPSNPFVSDGSDETRGRDLRVRLAQSPAVLVGSEGRAHAGRGHWPESGRRDQPGTRWRQPGLEQMGGQLQVHATTGGPRQSAQRSRPCLAYRRVRPQGSVVQQLVAITGVTVYRDKAIGALQNKLIFGDNPSGEVFYIDADAPSNGGMSSIRRILLNDGGTPKTLLQTINDKNAAQGKPAARRVDLRFGFGPKGEIFLLNKRDGVIRLLVPDGTKKARV